MAYARSGDATNRFGIVHAGMAVRCAPMLIPVAGFLVAVGTVAGPGSVPVMFALITLCLGVYVAMFTFTGKACQGTSGKPIEGVSFEDLVPMPVTGARPRA